MKPLRMSAAKRRHEKALGRRQAVEAGGTALAHAQAPPFSLPWPQAAGQPPSVDRHPVRAQNRVDLERSAAGDGLRLGRGVLGPAARLARRRGVGRPAQGALGRVALRGQDRLEPGGSGCYDHPGFARRRQGGQNTHRPGPGRHQRPSAHRWRWTALGDANDGSQSARLHAASGPGGRGAAGGWQARCPTP